MTIPGHVYPFLIECTSDHYLRSIGLARIESNTLTTPLMELIKLVKGRLRVHEIALP
jgi:hypothetical protein